MGSIKANQGKEENMAIMFRGSKELRESLRALAKKKDRSLSNYIKNVLIEHVNKQI